MTAFASCFPMEENALATESEKAATKAHEIYQQKAMRSLQGKYPYFVVKYFYHLIVNRHLRAVVHKKSRVVAST